MRFVVIRSVVAGRRIGRKGETNRKEEGRSAAHTECFGGERSSRAPGSCRSAVGPSAPLSTRCALPTRSTCCCCPHQIVLLHCFFFNAKLFFDTLHGRVLNIGSLARLSDFVIRIATRDKLCHLPTRMHIFPEKVILRNSWVIGARLRGSFTMQMRNSYSLESLLSFLLGAPFSKEKLETRLRRFTADLFTPN